MKNNKGFGVIATSLIIVVVLVIGGVSYYASKNLNLKLGNVTEDNFPQENQVVNDTQSDCIVVNSPQQNEKVGDIIKVTGYVTGCDNWTANIGVAGEMYIKDENGNILNDSNNALDGNLNVDGWDWKLNYPANFTGQIEIVKQPETKFGILTINNENQSDNFSLDRKIEIKLDLSDVKISLEVFKNQPGAIKSIKVQGDNQWFLAVDLLGRNSKWTPGSDEPFFINQNSKIRNLNVTSNTKTYNCGSGLDNNDTSADVLVNTSVFIGTIVSNDYKTRYFDIKGNNISAIYEQCLP